MEISAALIAALLVALLAIFTVLRAVRIVPQARAGVVERLDLISAADHIRHESTARALAHDDALTDVEPGAFARDLVIGTNVAQACHRARPGRRHSRYAQAR